jgi:dipicolinate synthase subunit B
MLLEKVKVGFAVTGSYCTFEKIIPEISRLVSEGADVLPIMSYNTVNYDTRFGEAKNFVEKVKLITGKEVICTMTDAEPVGPMNLTDIMVIAPCTGNTMAKLANAITDTPVLMAVKAHLRNGKPVVIGISTNDGLGMNAKNLGMLMNTKNMYFIPFRQDQPISKPNSLVAKMELIIPTIIEALKGKQIQPVLLGN